MQYYYSRQSNSRVRISSWFQVRISSWIFELDFPVKISSWILKLARTRVGLSS